MVEAPRADDGPEAGETERFTPLLSLRDERELLAAELRDALAQKEHQTTEHHAALEESGRRIAELDRAIAELQTALAAKERELSRVYASTSWRITGPIRRFLDRVRRRA